MKKLYIICTMACCLAACKPNITPEAPKAGSADFSRYMVIGDSYSSGFADGTLYLSGQQNSMPAILAEQFALAGGGAFKQPLLPGELGFPHPKNVLAMAPGCDGIPFLHPVHETGSGQYYESVMSQEPFNNIATPGMRIGDFLLTDYIGTLEHIKPGELPFASRFYHNSTYSPIQQMDFTINALNPTFFTLWLGFFDVFLYAQSGGIGNPNPPGGAPGSTDITGLGFFGENYDSLMQHLVKNDIKGVVLNIPDILDMPYFNTVPLDNPDGLRFFMRSGADTIPIPDNSYLLLEMPIDSLKCADWGSRHVPIPGRWVLSGNEVTNVRNAIAAFNVIIKNAAEKYGLAFVDVNAYLKSIQPGVIFNGVHYTPEFAKGGAYSLDGLHFTQRGYALIANQVINSINSKYGSTLPQIDVNKYRGVLFP